MPILEQRVSFFNGKPTGRKKEITKSGFREKPTLGFVDGSTVAVNPDLQSVQIVHFLWTPQGYVRDRVETFREEAINAMPQVRRRRYSWQEEPVSATPGPFHRLRSRLNRNAN